MADLDDFFTKRDKKKKPAAKSKFSVLDTEDIAKQLEATCKVAAAASTVVDGEENVDVDPVSVADDVAASSAISSAPASNQNVNSGEIQDEEWKPFDSDENKDYSGLRINIQNWKVEDEENNYEETNEESERKAACPWGAANIKAKLAKSQESESVENVEQPVEKTESTTTVSEETSKSESPATTEPSTNGPAAATTTTTTEAPALTPGAYIPPALKRQMEAAAAAAAASSGSSSAAPASSASAAAAASSAPVGKYIPPSMRNRAPEGGSLISSNATSLAPKKLGKAQPNIMDTFEFPTLDSAAPAETGDKLTNGNSDKFEMAKKGSRTEGAKTGKGNTIDLENKFTALEASSNH